MPRAQRASAGRTAKVAALLLLLMIIAGALLEMRRGGASAADLAEYARVAALDPLDLIEEAARSRRLLFLADVRSATAPKVLAAQAVERLAAGPGLDLLVLDIPAEEQPYVDRYLATTPEDAGILLTRPRAIREGDAASRSLIDLYRAVWRVNEQLGAHQRVRIVAADHPDWPPARAVSPQQAAVRFGERDAHMLDAVVNRARSPGARVLFLLDGLHALRSGGGRIQIGGADAVQTTWLAARMTERFPQDVYSILLDAPPARSVTAEIAAYRGTQLAEPLRRAGVRTGIALRGAPALDAVTRSPIRVVGTTGLDFTLEPRVAPFSRFADAYIYFGS